MKICPNCGAQLGDEASFCSNCGAGFGGQPPFGQNPFVDQYDHTHEFDPKDISDNKVFAMVVYLLGIVGVIIALLASHTSQYAMFHVRQVLKITVTEILLGICTVLLAWTFVVPILAAIAFIVLFVIKIIGFFQVCAGTAKEPAIIRSLGFLK